MSKLTEAELKIIKVLKNPILWAESTLRDPTPGRANKPLRLRWHQKKMLAKDKMRVVSRCGRRTGKTLTMVVYMLWYAFTHEDSTQIVATPYDNQIQLIFEMLHKFIDASPELKESKLSSKKSPWQIVLKNGAAIKGFTAGTKSGNEGGSLRGQRADVVYMDEIDYMTDGDFETIFAIALENPENTKVWISSTPTGRRGKFWQACTGQMPGWTEYYYWAGMINPDWKEGDPEYNRMVNPNWSVAMEKELKASYSTHGYQHEILAEFGEETIGVFKKEYIDRARQKYEYIESRINGNPMILGVDWDKFIVLLRGNSKGKNFVNCGKPLRALSTKLPWEHDSGAANHSGTVKSLRIGQSAANHLTQMQVQRLSGRSRAQASSKCEAPSG